MKEEYDFSNAEQGKFYQPLENLDIPVYLDKDVKAYFAKRLKEDPHFSVKDVVNKLLKKDIEISNQLVG